MRRGLILRSLASYSDETTNATLRGDLWTRRADQRRSPEGESRRVDHLPEKAHRGGAVTRRHQRLARARDVNQRERKVAESRSERKCMSGESRYGPGLMCSTPRGVGGELASCAARLQLSHFIKCSTPRGVRGELAGVEAGTSPSPPSCAQRLAASEVNSP